MATASPLRARGLLLLTSLALLAAATVPATSGSNDWPGFQNDARRSGFQAGEDLPDELEIIWRAHLQGNIKASPVVADGIVFMVTEDANAYGLDARNGRALWGPIALAEPAIGTPAYENDRLYVATSKLDGSAGKIHVIDASTGRYIQNVTLTKGSYGGVAIHDGKLFVGQDDGAVVAYDTESMSKLWTFSTAVKIDKAGVPAEGEGRPDCCARSDIGAKAVKTIPLVYGDRVYFGSFNHLFFAVDSGGTPGAETTKQIWVENLNDIIYSSAGIGSGGYRGDDVLVVGSYNGQIRAFDPDPLGSAVSCPTLSERQYHPTGNDCSDRIHWIFNTGSRVFASPAIANGRAYIGDESGSFHAMSMENGNGVWTYETGTSIRSSAAVVGDTIVVGGYDGKLYIFKEDGSGSLLPGFPKTVALSDKIHSSPAIAHGKVFTATVDGVVYALAAPGTPVPQDGPGAPLGNPDFQLKDLVLTPRKAVAGQPLEVTVNILNSGGSAGPVQVRLYNGDALVNESLAEVPGGKTVAHSLAFTPEAGDLFLRVTINEDAAVEELAQDNNLLEQHHVAEVGAAQVSGGTPDGAPGPEDAPESEGEEAPSFGIPLFVTLLTGLIAITRRRQ